MTLDQIPVGDAFTISTVRSRGEIRKRLVDMGFVYGANGKVLRKALLGDPIELRLGAYLISIRASEARDIEVCDVEVNR
ncbi:MAG: ferrous iron transport protein A [Polyangiaceae bacterium]|nr:ferrous iron transport protein A [Polyangiaceae bacterium]